MKRIAILTTLVAALLAAGVARAQSDESELGRLFPHEADVSAPKGDGLARLRLPPEVLREARGDLADVRLLDGDGHEVPFLLDSARRPLWLRSPRTEEHEAELVAVDQRRTFRSGRYYHEELIVAAPPGVSPSGSWDLVFEVRQRHFVTQLTVLDPAQPERIVAKSSVFRLDNPLREGVRVALPADLPERLRIVLRGDQPYLEPVVRYQATRAPAASRLTLPLQILEREARAGTTVLTLSRPRGIVPDRIEIVSTTGTFYRKVEVVDAGQGAGGRTLGSQALFRDADLDGVADLGVWIEQPAGDALEIRIDDGDSPALSQLEVVAVIDQPALVFDLEGRGRLLFGGGRAHAPGYDLQRLVGTAAGEALALRGALREASVSEARANVAFDPSPALAFLMRPGPPVARERYSHRRRIQVKEAPEGASRLRLGAEDLAKARADLGDVRIVDDADRQQPYLLERRGVDEHRAVVVEAPSRDDAGTHYRLALPASPIAMRSLSLQIRERYFDRPYRMVAGTGDDAVTIAAGSMHRQRGERGPIVLPMPSDERFASLQLVVDDGDDAALTIEAAECSIPSADLYLVAPVGFYWLIVGAAEAEPARYELSGARDLVLALPAAEVSVGALEPNPGYAPPEPEGPPRLVLWAVLALAVAALGALTLRAARTPTTPDASEAPPEGPPAPGPTGGAIAAPSIEEQA